MMIAIIMIILAFLCGSIPTGYILIKKIYGIDIRTQWSGNIGSTNVKRVAGRKISIITQVIDIVKGLVPVAVAMAIAYNYNIGIDKNLFFSLVALAAILGHDYTPFLKFNGGKGVNTTLGAYFLLSPIAILSGAAMYFALKLVTNIVSIRSMALSITIPVVSTLLGRPTIINVFTGIAALLLIFRHRENIGRIVRGEEK